MDEKEVYSEEVQEGVTLTIEVEGEETQARPLERDEPHQEDLIEFYNPMTGAMSRLELIQNTVAEAER